MQREGEGGGRGRGSGLSLDYLHNVFVVQDVIFPALWERETETERVRKRAGQGRQGKVRRRSTHLLRLMLDATSPDPGVLELRQDLFVDSVAEVFDGGRGGVQHHRGAVVRDLSLGLGVDSNHVCGLPDPLHELLQVPLVAEVCEERDGG
jgi:hypothetical protein